MVRGELLEHGGRLIAKLGDRGGRGLSQIRALVRQPPKVDLQGSDIGQGRQGQSGLERDSGVSAAAIKVGIACAIVEVSPPRRSPVADQGGGVQQAGRGSTR